MRREKSSIKAVISIPYTHNSELVRRIKENEIMMEKMTGVRIKIEEKTVTQLEKVLTKSNTWSGRDCERERCLMCTTRAVSG